MEQLVALPNSLPREPKTNPTLSGRGLEWLYIYCASCGKDGGSVLKCDVPNREEFAFYLCDPCAEKYGKIDGTHFVPDEMFFAKVREASIERHGRELLESEVHKLLDDPNSFISKLVKDRNTFLASE
jgi:hypothetical protein